MANDYRDDRRIPGKLFTREKERRRWLTYKLRMLDGHSELLERGAKRGKKNKTDRAGLSRAIITRRVGTYSRRDRRARGLLV